MPTPVLELVTFRLIPGTDPAAFAAAAEATRPLVAARPGFRARHLAQDREGWADLVVWDSLTAAEAAAQAVMADPAFAPFMAMIAPDSVVMRHLKVALAMPGPALGD